LLTRQRLGEPFIIAQLDESDLVSRTVGWRSIMSVPITSGGELIGSILFAVCDPRPAFDYEQLAIAEELGRRAAVALQGARSYRDAQAATVGRDEMLAVVAHDLRNPLNTISMGSSMMLEMMTDPNTLGRRQFEIIYKSTEHMNRLIQDLLDATRLQSGQLALEQMPASAQMIVDEAMDVLQPLAMHAGIAFEAQVAHELPKLWVDRIRVLQVLSNLVGNAIKFTPRGGQVTLLVNSDRLGACFCVRDNGAGIAPDQVPHIFGRFWQARRTDRRGLGLGLAIAKGIVEAHGGRIWVESVLGAGSDFLFTMPQQPA
jgi:signal transduction histidine kinase